MPDELIPTETPPVETPPEETPPVETPPPDPNVYDERGVPYKNVAAEMQRKYAEALERERQYQQRLGAQYQQAQQPPPQPTQTEDELETFVSQFDPNVQKALRGMAQVLESRAEKKARTVARAEGYDLIAQLTHNQEVQDPAMLEEARRQRAILDSNPLWANAPETLRNDRAIAEAKLIMKSKAPAPVAARPVAAAPPPAMPGTRPAAPAQQNTREAFITKWVSDPNNIEPIRKLYGKKFDEKDPKIQKMLRASAEEILDKGELSFWGGGVKSAAEAILSQAETQRSRT